MECNKRGSVCVIDESSDKRRKSYFMRMEEDLKCYREFLDKFFEAIRTSTDNDVQHIIDVVQSAPSISEVQMEVARVLEGSYLSR